MTLQKKKRVFVFQRMMYSLKYKQTILFLRETDGSTRITGSSIDQKNVIAQY